MVKYISKTQIVDVETGEIITRTQLLNDYVQIGIEKSVKVNEVHRPGKTLLKYINTTYTVLAAPSKQIQLWKNK